MLSKSRFFLNRIIVSRNFCRDPLKNKIMNQVQQKPQEKTRSSKALLYGAATCLLLAGGYMLYVQKSLPQEKTQTVKVLGEAVIGGPWQVLQSEGKFLKDTDLLGKYVVYYFGFTRCPDICPASLQKLALTIDNLHQRGQKNVEFLFVSLDPESDTVEKVKDYSKIFHKQIRGVLVPKQQLPSFLKTFRIYARKIYSGDDYMLDHTSYMYLFNKEGRFIDVLGANLTYEELADKIEDHVKSSN